MIQVNLLPSVKQKLLKLQRTRNFVVSVAILIAIGSVISVAIVGGWFFAIKGAEIMADNAIKSEYAKLSETKELDKALTIKSQLEELSSSHGNKRVVSRIFNLLTVTTSGLANNVKFSSIDADVATGAISIEAQASTFGDIETFKKTLEKTKLEYRVNDEKEKKIESVASNIKISESSMSDNSEGGKNIRFKIEFTYNEAMLLYSSRDAFFKAPKKTIATDSKLNMPNDLFTKGLPNDSKGDK